MKEILLIEDDLDLAREFLTKERITQRKSSPDD